MAYSVYCPGCNKLMAQGYGQAAGPLGECWCGECGKGETMDIDKKLIDVIGEYLIRTGKHPNALMICDRDYRLLYTMSQRYGAIGIYFEHKIHGCKVFVHPDPCQISCTRIEATDRRSGDDRRG